MISNIQQDAVRLLFTVLRTMDLWKVFQSQLFIVQDGGPPMIACNPNMSLESIAKLPILLQHGPGAKIGSCVGIRQRVLPTEGQIIT